MRPATLTVNLNHLIENYHLLQKQAGKASVMAVVKASAYGHGLLPVSQALFQAGCRSFAVTDAEEGALLRNILANDSTIALFSGVFDAQDAALCQTHQLTPVIATSAQLHLLQQAEFSRELWLKVDTGMSRIGAEDLHDLKDAIPATMKLAGVMSHLACADTPAHPLNQQQIEKFQYIKSHVQAPAYSLLNSAGLIAFTDKLSTQVVRPGIALYGIEPIPEQPLGLKPVASLSSQVMQVRHIQKGESVSYSASWVAPKAMMIAIVALGYADGLPRLLSNQGHAWHAQGLLPIAGRVCMDYCMLAVDNLDVKTGDEVVFFGAHANQPKANQVAAQCQTISYEIFTGLGARLNRRYIGEQ